jgi:hypothetical protein
MGTQFSILLIVMESLDLPEMLSVLLRFQASKDSQLLDSTKNLQVFSSLRTQYFL